MIRASLRLLLIVLWSLAFAPTPLLAALATLGSRRGAARTGPFLMKGFSTGICAILGVRIEPTGEPPSGACLVAPNHWGYVDVFVLGSLYRDLFVSRADVADWPIVGIFARAGGTLFIRRDIRKDAARVGDAIERDLRLGGRVTAFLEGGAGDGTHVRPFKSALVQAAVAAGVPCVPVALRYELPAGLGLDAATAVAWIDGGFFGHLWRLLHVRRIDAKVSFLPPRTGTDRKALARALEGDVRAELAVSASARTPGRPACTR